MAVTAKTVVLPKIITLRPGGVMGTRSDAIIARVGGIWDMSTLAPEMLDLYILGGGRYNRTSPQPPGQTWNLCHCQCQTPPNRHSSQLSIPYPKCHHIVNWESKWGWYFCGLHLGYWSHQYWSTGFHHYSGVLQTTWVWHTSHEINVTFRRNGRVLHSVCGVHRSSC